MRLKTALVGVCLVLGGIALMPLPGPGIVVVVAAGAAASSSASSPVSTASASADSPAGTSCANAAVSVAEVAREVGAVLVEDEAGGGELLEGAGEGVARTQQV